MKRLLSLLLAVAMLLCLTACGGNAPAEDNNTHSTTTTTTAAESDGTTTTTTEGTTTTTESQPSDTTGGPTITEAPTTTTTTEAPTTTTTTQKPTTTTTTITYDPVPESISILSVGNSFSVDAMRGHLYQMLAAAGYKNIRLGILYIGGCSIDKHYECIRRDTGSYEYYENVNGEWVITPNYKASDAFKLTDWDYVTLQQVSSDSGRSPSYENLDALMDLIQPQIGDAKMYWQMTWAYQQDSTHSAFGNYNKDQMRMYRGIRDATKKMIVDNPDFVGIIPSGTSIQNLRTSSLGDTLTSDGHHLSDSYGDYTAALTWFCTFSGRPATSMSYRPASIANHFDEIAQSVDNAMTTPFAVTPCK